jgi:hypothetical protein
VQKDGLPVYRDNGMPKNEIDGGNVLGGRKKVGLGMDGKPLVLPKLGHP